jgi:hypothetical protein
VPPGTLKAINKLERAFVWAGRDKTTGAKCKVNWEEALQEVENELPTNGVISLTNIELEEECRSLRLVEPCGKVLDVQKIVMDASFLDKGAL